MAYLLLFCSIISYSYFFKPSKQKLKHFIPFFIPIGILLIMIYGLQYDVGSDYFSYLRLADGTKDIEFLLGKFEILFVFLVLFVRKLNCPQLIFVFTAIIQVIFFMLITYEVKKMGFRLDYYFFLYFTLSLVFFNQFNGIRQYTAVYIIIYALFKLMKGKKYLYTILVLVASLFHVSAWIFFVFLLLDKLLIKEIPKKFIIVAIIVLFILSLFDLTKYYKIIIQYIPQYRSYIGSSYMKRLSFQGIITKIPKLMIVLYCALGLDMEKQDIKKRYLINISYMACSIMVLSFTSSIIWRFYQYFDFFIIFPVMIFANNKRKIRQIKFISLLLIIMIIIKILVIPRGEYLYNSIFHW